MFVIKMILIRFSLLSSNPVALLGTHCPILSQKSENHEKSKIRILVDLHHPKRSDFVVITKIITHRQLDSPLLNSQNGAKRGGQVDGIPLMSSSFWKELIFLNEKQTPHFQG